ncbi:RHS repeat-associated core domain-containing protein [Lysinibacillus sp. JK80]
MYYNRFRYYDSDVGMYTQPDPIGLAGNKPNAVWVCRDPLMGLIHLG